VKPSFLAAIPLFAISTVSAAQSEEQLEFFETKVRAVLAEQCYSCHTTSQLGGLRLDSRDAVLKGGQSGAVIVPGKPEASLLIERVRDPDPKRRMPMGGSLSEAAIGDLAKWISMGAPWPETTQPSAKHAFALTPEQKNYWAFRDLQNVTPPQVLNREWVRSPIDTFVLANLEAKGMKPSRPATKLELIRRATFDLTGLPPTPAEIDAFVADTSAAAYPKLIDRLLASPHYGERWGRYWLDVVRYGEDDVRGAVPAGFEPYENAFRYRDWVIQAVNDDMPYDLFVKAQLAGDLLNHPDRKKLIGGLGMFGFGPWYFDLADAPQARANERNDRVDVVTRGFLGLTGACARCHDHKYDPISTKDYYALAGVFASSDYREYPLVPEPDVQDWKAKSKQVKEKEKNAKDFADAQSAQLAELLAHKTSRYMMAAWQVLGPAKVSAAKAASDALLDREILERWVSYLSAPERNHPYLKDWDRLLKEGATEPELRKIADSFQAQVLAVIAEKKAVDAYNNRVLGEAREKRGAPFAYLPNDFALYDGDTDSCFGLTVVVKSLDREKYVLWSELIWERQVLNRGAKEPGVLLYKGDQLDRFLSPEWKDYIHALKAEAETLKSALPPRYPYFQVLGESSRIGNLKVHLRGSPYNLGEEVPRRFLAVLSKDEPRPFQQGSGRLELAEQITSHPLAARVMVNRIWQHHFGRGIVGTPSNFGRLGDKPSEPELLEYLASRFVKGEYSAKKLHREIMLSATYLLSSEFSQENFNKDPDNRLFWRANRQRLDAESLRDALLFVSGDLDTASMGGPSQELDLKSTKRSVYLKVSRFKLNPFLSLFDFPDPGMSAELRNVTNVPLQGLFFLNSPVVAQQASHLARRLEREAGADSAARVQLAYRLLFGRPATMRELDAAEKFLHEGDAPSAWRQYAQALLSSNEFVFVN
jgi:cytochrome c553/mono/diheme cytochrome c family protein